MADTTLSPNMALPVPTVSEAPGPDWADYINSCMSVIDQHNHTDGSGVPITPAAISMNADLPFNQKNATQVRSIRLFPQTATFSAAADIGCVYEVGVDLYYRDGNANNIRITQSGAVSGASGTITGLPSGTASAVFSAGTFTFQSATSTPAAFRHGPLSIGEQTASPNFVTLQSPTALASSYSLTFPTALPAGVRFVTLDNTGALAVNSTATTGTGGIVLATSPTIVTPTLTTPTLSSPIFSGTAGGSITSLTLVTPVFSGTPTGTVTAATFSPTYVWSNTVTVNDASWMYHRIGNIVFVTGTILATNSVGSITLTSVTVPVSTTSLASIAGIASGGTTQGVPITVLTSNTFSPGGVGFGGSAGVATRFAFTYSYTIV